MDPSIISHLKRLIHQSLTNHTKDSIQRSSLNFFDILMENFHHYYNRPIHNLTEMRQRGNKKIKGDIFEHFCWLYMTHCCNLETWFLQDVPSDILEQLNLRRQDFGIDLLSRDNQGRFYAIQAKYRTRNKYRQKTGISWKQLSTFYALAEKTGPYWQHIVITNVDYVRHIAKKTPKDRSICLGSLRNIMYDQWLHMAGSVGYKLGNSGVNTPSVSIPGQTLNLSHTMIIEPEKPAKIIIQQSEHEIIRKKRLARFECCNKE